MLFWNVYLLNGYLVQNPSKKKKGANRKMKITFNDGQELQIQQVTEQTDGALLIKTISAEEEQLKTLFSDAVATKRMSVSERDADTVVYENYTKLDAIVKYTAGILGVMVVGAMIPSYVTFAFPEKLKLFGTVGVQSIFDSVIPNLLPALFVGILYYIFKKKKVSIVVLILAIIAFAILMSLLGWL